MTDALVMAGGRGERMRASLGDLAKPLVRVRGLELIERNLAMLLREGCRSIAVSVGAAMPEIATWIEHRGRLVARAAGASLHTLREDQPLGTIGVAARLRDASEVLVVNADNLVTLDLGALRAHHRAMDAAMTVATHLHPFRIPFGEVVAAAGLLEDYREKPEIPVRVSSGTYVLGAGALAALAPEARCDVPTLVARLRARGLRVGAFAHDSPWVDVNDAEALRRAESLVAQHPGRFEGHACPAAVAVVGVLLWEHDAVLLEARPATARAYAGLWDTPGGKVATGESPEAAMLRECEEELGISPALTRLADFDDLDPTSGRVFRHTVFEARGWSGQVRPREGQTLRWWPRSALGGEGFAIPARRALAWSAHR